MEIYSLKVHDVIALPPFHAIAVNIMAPASQPLGKLIDPSLATTLDPWVDRIIDIGDLQRPSSPFFNRRRLTNIPEKIVWIPRMDKIMAIMAVWVS